MAHMYAHALLCVAEECGIIDISNVVMVNTQYLQSISNMSVALCKNDRFAGLTARSHKPIPIRLRFMRTGRLYIIRISRR